MSSIKLCPQSTVLRTAELGQKRGKGGDSNGKKVGKSNFAENVYMMIA